ncbi:MAG TPA: tRNA pseudouridine(55) synthase TruB [Flavobacteriaceae bacterium]|nr:tRNA pseudouridine(55) synthase TruB [Flavobacteriaceae bacterium]
MQNKFSPENFKKGQLLLLDKPLGWTSFQVVNKVRWLIRKSCDIKKIKVGHAGTLDPLADGLLLICTGRFTKRIQEFQGMEKEYTGTFTLGATTPSFDLETEIEQYYPVDHLNEKVLKEKTRAFIGEIVQYPPVFSAIKKNGKRLYEYARSGEQVKIDSRKVQISSFELTKIALPEVDFKVVCGKGTYIRSLAHDFGKSLNSGAYLSSLRRTRIGTYSVEDALDIDGFIKLLPNTDSLK